MCKKRGFALVEVMTAVAIAGFALSALFALQSSIVRSLTRSGDQWRLIIALKNSTYAEREKPSEKEQGIIFERRAFSLPTEFKKLSKQFKAVILEARTELRQRAEKIAVLILYREPKDPEKTVPEKS